MNIRLSSDYIIIKTILEIDGKNYELQNCVKKRTPADTEDASNYIRLRIAKHMQDVIFMLLDEGVITIIDMDDGN